MHATPIHHRSRGDGTHALVLLHGFLGSGKNLGSLAASWCERHPSERVHLPDLPGHGDSRALTSDDTLHTAAQALSTWKRAHIGTDPIRIAGHSLGGKVALAWLDVAPDDLNQIVLLDIAPGPTVGVSPELELTLKNLIALPPQLSSRQEAINDLTRRGTPLILAQWLAMNLQRDGQGFSWKIDRQQLADFHRRFDGADLWSIAEKMPTCIAVIKGERSSYVSPHACTKLTALGIDVAVVADAGHFLHLDNAPGVLAALERCLAVEGELGKPRP